MGTAPGVYLTLINSAPHDEHLIRVTTTHAEDVRLHWDKECDGTAETVDQIPLTAGGTVPASSAADEIGHLPYHLQLIDINQLVFPGTTIPLTFTFATAGSVTVDAMVQTRPHAAVDGQRACSGDTAALPRAGGPAGDAVSRLL